MIMSCLGYGSIMVLCFYIHPDLHIKYIVHLSSTDQVIMTRPSHAMVSLSLTFLGLISLVSGLGQKPIISFNSSDSFQIVGGDVGTGQIRVSKEEYWGVIRAAGDLAVDFGRVTGTNFTLSNGENNASPAKYKFEPANVKNNTFVCPLPL